MNDRGFHFDLLQEASGHAAVPMPAAGEGLVPAVVEEALVPAAVEGALVPAAKRRRVRADLPPPVVAPLSHPWLPGEFTPVCVNDEKRCQARTWGGGKGGQCRRAAVRDGLCKIHLQSNAHGRVTEAPPLEKLRAFRSCV